MHVHAWSGAAAWCFWRACGFTQILHRRDFSTVWSVVARRAAAVPPAQPAPAFAQIRDVYAHPHTIDTFSSLLSTRTSSAHASQPKHARRQSSSGAAPWSSTTHPPTRLYLGIDSGFIAAGAPRNCAGLDFHVRMHNATAGCRSCCRQQRCRSETRSRWVDLRRRSARPRRSGATSPTLRWLACCAVRAAADPATGVPNSAAADRWMHQRQLARAHPRSVSAHSHFISNTSRTNANHEYLLMRRQSTSLTRTRARRSSAARRCSAWTSARPCTTTRPCDPTRRGMH